MNEQVWKSLNDRCEYLSHLREDLSKNDELLDEIAKELQSLTTTCKNIKDLSKYPEHVSLLPLSKNIYVPGRIIHTGEYYSNKRGHPDSYLVLQTAEQTIEGLENKMITQRDIQMKAELAKNQLEERINVLKGESDDERDDLPKIINSDKGMAVKVGQLYEILEFEED